MFFNHIDSFDKYAVLFRKCCEHFAGFAFIFTSNNFYFITFFDMHWYSTSLISWNLFFKELLELKKRSS
ncbi:50S ribosomal protein L24 [Listeria monocytogenes]|nr:50S ribosomal protein L24 [Listeria monocytogenes]GAT39624.1 50S ribosomal protein L24 [Listeria monocytogenes]